MNKTGFAEFHEIIEGHRAEVLRKALEQLLDAAEHHGGVPPDEVMQHATSQAKDALATTLAKLATDQAPVSIDADAFEARLRRAAPPVVEPPECFGCGLRYSSKAWADVVIPDEFWKRIASNGGVLCFNCMNEHLEHLGLRNVPYQIASGPFAFAVRDVSGKSQEATGAT